MAFPPHRLFLSPLPGPFPSSAIFSTGFRVPCSLRSTLSEAEGDSPSTSTSPKTTKKIQKQKQSIRPPFQVRNEILLHDENSFLGRFTSVRTPIFLNGTLRRTHTCPELSPRNSARQKEQSSLQRTQPKTTLLKIEDAVLAPPLLHPCTESSLRDPRHKVRHRNRRNLTRSRPSAKLRRNRNPPIRTRSTRTHRKYFRRRRPANQ